METLYEVSHLIDVAVIDGRAFFLVAWKGYGRKDDTYEPRERLLEDIPDLVLAFKHDNFVVWLPTLTGDGVETLRGVETGDPTWNALYSTHRNALHCAAVKDDHRRVRQLVRLKANVNVRDHGGNTPLHYVFHKEMLPKDFDPRQTRECVTTLQSLKADVHAFNKSGQTPLDVARDLQVLQETRDSGDVVIWSLVDPL